MKLLQELQRILHCWLNLEVLLSPSFLSHDLFESELTAPSVGHFLSKFAVSAAFILELLDLQLKCREFSTQSLIFELYLPLE